MSIAMVIIRLWSKAFNTRFSWAQSINKKTKGDIVPIDYKMVRGSRDIECEKSLIHMVSA